MSPYRVCSVTTSENSSILTHVSSSLNVVFQFASRNLTCTRPMANPSILFIPLMALPAPSYAKAKLWPPFWVEALNTTTLLLNWCPSRVINILPTHHLMCDIHQSYDHICVFGYCVILIGMALATTRSPLSLLVVCFLGTHREKVYHCIEFIHPPCYYLSTCSFWRGQFSIYFVIINSTPLGKIYETMGW